MKKLMAGLMTAVLLTTTLVGCGGNPTQGDTGAKKNNAEITVVSREDGSGTRGAFVELMKIEEKSADGAKKDLTTKEAVIANKTDVMLTNISGDKNAIGYASLGSMSDSVKALKVDGVVPTAENVKNKTYKVSRPFNIATKAEPTAVTKDFISFIMSAEGQEVVGKDYVTVNDAAPKYEGTKVEGKVVVAGSSSVSPIMEKLKEAYMKVNPGATVEVQMSDSSAGMTGAAKGTCDIGMASRDLKDSEKEALTATAIALDGIVIIVNPANELNEITSENIKKIFKGDITTWGEING